MKINIIYHKLFDFNGNGLTIGGIQTYILNLSKMLSENNYETYIYQLSNYEWEKKIGNVKIIGIKKLDTSSEKKQSNHILKNILNNNYSNNDLIIWGTDYISVKNKEINSISIQHGIAFDFTLNKDKKQSLLRSFGLEFLYLFYQRYRSIKSFTNSKYTVCVDYNYLNWIRTMIPRSKLSENINVIPNFTEISNLEHNYKIGQKPTNILFARRFVEQRGIFILYEILDYFISKNTDLFFTIAGDGPYKDDLVNRYENYKNINIITYEHHESLKIHSEHHISLIPTWGGEGTSLSLLESMTAGCVPIATNVGGMTNIILDEFNGFLVNPDAKDFIDKIETLYNDPELYLKISRNAKLSVDSAFSYEKWATKWLKLISSIKDKK